MHPILLVEDNEDDIFLIKDALERAAVANPVHALPSAEEAIEYLEGAGKYANRISYPIPVVVFVDLKLPGKSGHEFLRWMNGKPALNHVLRAVLTGSDDPKDRQRAYELGANCYLEKPVTTDQLTRPSRNLSMVLRGEHA